MAQVLSLAMKGLFSHQDPLSEVPEGALEVANNVVIDREGLAESRRGFIELNAYSLATDRINSITTFEERLVYHYGTIITYDLAPASGAGFGGSDFNPPDVTSNKAGFKIRFQEMRRNLYFTTDKGVWKKEGTQQPAVSGMYKALGGTGVTVGTTGFMTTNTAVAYRVLWGNRDSHDAILLGAPSERIVVANTSGANRDITLSITIPAGINSAHFFQVYRSNPSATATDSPNDELQLVYEANPTSAERIAKSITFTDNVPDNLKRATIYTAPSQEGIAKSNSPPPFAKDISVYKNHMFYGNTRLPHQVTFTILSVGTGGIQVGTTIDIDGTTFRGDTVEDASINEFLVDTTGTPSENINITARSLVRVINQSTTNTTIYAYYVSGFEDLPGQIFVERRNFDDTLFKVESNTDAFDPQEISKTGYAGGTESKNDNNQNKLYYSKESQPDAVPVLNYFSVGSADQPIQRILALRESLYIFKRDGIYRLIGESENNFRIILTDNTTRIRGAETAVVHNNQILMMSDQGVVSVSENGDVAILSRPIENTLLELSTNPDFEKQAFSISYESDRKFIMWVPSVDNDETVDYCDTAYVYNMLTKSWTTWDYTFLNSETNASSAEKYNVTAGIVNPENDKLYTCVFSKGFFDTPSVGDIKILEERKDFMVSDYADDEIAVIIVSSQSDFEVELLSLINFPDAWIGATFAQEGGGEAVITGVGVSLNNRTTLTLNSKFTWSIGAGTIYVPIETNVKWTPIHCGNAGMIKHFREVSILFEDASFFETFISFDSNFGSGEGEITLVPTTNIGWGAVPWGDNRWGFSLGGGRQPLRTWFTREVSRAHWVGINIRGRQALTRFGLSGASVVYSDVSTKFRGK